jgi:hypothetical protein
LNESEYQNNYTGPDNSAELGNNGGPDNSTGPNSPDDYSRLKGTVARRNMATASLVCAIIALVTIQFFFISLPLGGTSVILALLSRGSGRTHGRTRIAVIGGAAAMVLSSLITVYAVRQVYTNPALRAQVEQLYNYYTGQIPGITDKAAESEEEEPLSESPQEILQNILSGEYRENQAQQQISGSKPEGISDNGGVYI